MYKQWYFWIYISSSKTNVKLNFCNIMKWCSLDRLDYKKHRSVQEWNELRERRSVQRPIDGHCTLLFFGGALLSDFGAQKKPQLPLAGVTAVFVRGRIGISVLASLQGVHWPCRVQNLTYKIWPNIDLIVARRRLTVQLRFWLHHRLLQRFPWQGISNQIRGRAYWALAHHYKLNNVRNASTANRSASRSAPRISAECAQ